MGRFGVALRLTLLLDEVVCGFVDLAIFGVKGNRAWAAFGQKQALDHPDNGLDIGSLQATPSNVSSF